MRGSTGSNYSIRFVTLMKGEGENMLTWCLVLCHLSGKVTLDDGLGLLLRTTVAAVGSEDR